MPYDAIIATPFGAIGISTRDDFITGLHYLTEDTPELASNDPFVQAVIGQLRAYLADASAPLDAPYAVKGTPFQKRVWQAIATIPSGHTLTYGELARQVHSGPRAVANVCGANQVPLFIPCHRVVAKGGLGGFMQGNAKGLSVKQWLLRHEQGAGA